ncbi:MAG: GDP-mannose 4,6-dehydratase [Planctomycetota bacterium]
MKILVTGGAGFIGSHTCEQLLAAEHRVVALDNFDRSYSPKLKRRNVATALLNPNYKLIDCDYGDRLTVSKLLEVEKFDAVLHLAAQVGARPSVYDPLKYERVNVGNLISLLEAMRQYGPKKIVAVSSSSVYGNVTPMPFQEDAACLQPLSPYGATKRAAEIFLRTYHTLYDFKVILARPFTVYGPRQRPDMAIASFARMLLMNETITLFWDGTSAHDYIYVTDIVKALINALETFPVDFGIYNLGSGASVSLSDLMAQLEQLTGKQARIERQSMQPGDVERTCADISKARQYLAFEPAVKFAEGLRKTVDWARQEL